MRLVIAAVMILGSALQPAKETPVVFQAGIISTSSLAEVGGTFSPDGHDFYFAVRTPTTTTAPLSAICVSHQRGRHWTRPEVVPFSGKFFDSGPALSPDGARMFFTSSRPVKGKQRDDLDLWVVTRSGNGWSEPANLGSPVNTDANEQTPSVSADGTLYFASDRSGGMGGSDLYSARFVNGAYQSPVGLGEAVNSQASELTPYITPDGQRLFFAAIGRTDMILAGGNPYARADLYVSRLVDGKWTIARQLPMPVNSVATEIYPFLSADGQTLYFSSERSSFAVPMKERVTMDELDRAGSGVTSGLSNIYSVPVTAIGRDQ